VIKRKTAQSRSDVSGESATEDKNSRHERCRIEYDDLEPDSVNVKKVKQATQTKANQNKPLAQVTVPPELMSATLSAKS
jgi:hypothetical protein